MARSRKNQPKDKDEDKGKDPQQNPQNQVEAEDTRTRDEKKGSGVEVADHAPQGSTYGDWDQTIDGRLPSEGAADDKLILEDAVVPGHSDMGTSDGYEPLILEDSAPAISPMASPAQTPDPDRNDAEIDSAGTSDTDSRDADGDVDKAEVEETEVEGPDTEKAGADAMAGSDDVASENIATDATTTGDIATDDIIRSGDAADDAEQPDQDHAGAEPKPAEQPEASQAGVTPPIAGAASSSSGFWGTVLGGGLAAALGFGVAIFTGAGNWPIFGGSATEGLDGIEKNARTIAALENKLQETQTGFDGAASRAEDRFAQIEKTLAALSERAAASPPAAGDSANLPDDLQAALQAQRSELDALQKQLEEMGALAKSQIAAAEDQQKQAKIAQARAAARGALNTIRLALAQGQAFSKSLPDIAAATDVPEALQKVAQDGVMDADTLKADYIPAARRALSASLRAQAGDTTGDRLKLFLQDQLGARSLSPREGDDPDAVLSRAEAAIGKGDLAVALETLNSLPEAGRTAMQEWTQAARNRMDALAAFDQLANALSAN